MSITTIIRSLENQGLLLRYVPVRITGRAKRCLFMSPNMLSAYSNPNSAVNLLTGRGHIDAALTLWSAGDHIYDDGKLKAGPGFLKRLSGPPPEVWEIKVTNPTPQSRVFGRFCEPDTFVATGMFTRPFLGRKGSANWHSAMNQCVDEWSSLFVNHPPHVGSRLAEYVTENRDDFIL